MVDGRFWKTYPPISKRIIWHLNKMLSEKRLSDWKPDILHQTYYNFSPSSFGEKARIITVYDMIHELHPESFLSGDRTSGLKLKAINQADHIICISETTRLDLMNITGIDGAKVSCIYLGTDKCTIKYPYPTLKGRVNRPYLLYVGARAGYKNFKQLINAYSSSSMISNDFDLIVVGGGGFSREELEKISSLKGLKGRILKVDIGASGLNALYQHASAFIYPSLYEGFGLPPLEAMANGCPVISSDRGSLKEIIGEAAEFFDPTSIMSMRSAMEAVLYSPERSRELVNSGFFKANEYTWRRCAQETFNLYENFKI